MTIVVGPFSQKVYSLYAKTAVQLNADACGVRTNSVKSAGTADKKAEIWSPLDWWGQHAPLRHCKTIFLWFRRRLLDVNITSVHPTLATSFYAMRPETARRTKTTWLTSLTLIERLDTLFCVVNVGCLYMYWCGVMLMQYVIEVYRAQTYNADSRRAALQVSEPDAWDLY